MTGAESTTRTENLSGIYGGQHGPAWSRLCKSTIGDPELMQPTILALSLTYIVVTASSYLNLLAPNDSSAQFTYYCCILGFISCIIFYLRLLYNESQQSSARIIYILVLLGLVGLYVGHWFVAAGKSYELSNDPDPLIDGYPANQNINVLSNQTGAQMRSDLVNEPQLDDSNGQVLSSKINRDNNDIIWNELASLQESRQSPQIQPNPVPLPVGKTTLAGCIDKRKCSHPLHLVAQSAFMAAVIVSLVASIFQ